MTDKTVKKPKVGGKLDAAAPALMSLGIALAAIGFVLAFTVAGLVNGAAVNEPQVINGTVVANKLLISQKIFYWHVPVAIASFGAIAFAAYYAIRFLMTKQAFFDMRAKLCMEVGLAFILCTMASGVLWTRYEWGVWWTWEPRLTTYFILMLMVIAYFILRNAVEDPERRATYASVFGILIFIDVPICFMITRLIPSSVHPVIFRTDSGLSPDMLVPFLLSLFGMALIAFGLYRFRLRTQVLEDEITRLSDALED